MRKTILFAVMTAMVLLASCTSARGTVGTAAHSAEGLGTQGAWNTQWWPDGASSTSSAQPFGAGVGLDSIDVMSTGPNGAFTIGSGGVLGLSPGDIEADSIDMAFFDPMTLDDGRIWSPPKTVSVRGFRSAKSPVIQATTAQVQLLAAALTNLSDNEKEQIIAGMERDGVITKEVAAALRDALGVVAPLLLP